MTAFDYAGKRDTADRLLTKFGRAMSLRQQVASGTPWEPTQTTTDYATIGVLLDYLDRQIDGENILRGDRRALLSAGPLTSAGMVKINPSDVLVIDGAPYATIIIGKPLAPAGLVVLYDCQLRF